MPAIGGEAEETCANCGRSADGLGPVRRVYLTVDGEGRPAGSETQEPVERWCASCRSLYPHEPADDPPPAGGEA